MALKHQEILTLLKTFLYCPGRSAAAGSALNDGDRINSKQQTWGIPFFIWDEPGTGKTTALEVFGYLLGFDYINSIAMNCRAPEDVGGYSVPNHETKTMDRYPDPWVNNANSAKRGIQIFDELTSDEESQAACLRVFSERMAGDIRINGAIRLVALGNPTWCAANGHDLSHPNANRFAHIQWAGMSNIEFGDWLLTGAGENEMEAIDADAHEAHVLKKFPTAWAKAAALVSRFLVLFPGMLHQMPKSGEPEQLRWPSRRNWENVTRFLASADIHGLKPHVQEAGIHAFFPEGLAVQFTTWMKNQDLPAPLDVLDNEGTKKQFKIGKKIDITAVVLDMTSAFLRDPDVDKRKKRAEGWWKFAKRVCEHKYGGADFVEPSVRRMCRPVEKGGIGLGEDEGIKGASDLVNSLYDVLSTKMSAKADLERTS